MQTPTLSVKYNRSIYSFLVLFLIFGNPFSLLAQENKDPFGEHLKTCDTHKRLDKNPIKGVKLLMKQSMGVYNSDSVGMMPNGLNVYNNTLNKDLFLLSKTKKRYALIDVHGQKVSLNTFNQITLMFPKSVNAPENYYHYRVRRDSLWGLFSASEEHHINRFILPVEYDSMWVYNGKFEVTNEIFGENLGGFGKQRILMAQKDSSYRMAFADLKGDVTYSPILPAVPQEITVGKMVSKRDSAGPVRVDINFGDSDCMFYMDLWKNREMVMLPAEIRFKPDTAFQMDSVLFALVDKNQPREGGIYTALDSTFRVLEMKVRMRDDKKTGGLFNGDKAFDIYYNAKLWTWDNEFVETGDFKCIIYREVEDAKAFGKTEVSKSYEFNGTSYQTLSDLFAVLVSGAKCK